MPFVSVAGVLSASRKVHLDRRSPCTHTARIRPTELDLPRGARSQVRKLPLLLPLPLPLLSPACRVTSAVRSMWEVISSLSTSRSVILTTHSMEECEAVCDRLGIMVGGRLRCIGTPQHLKGRFGGGYSVEVRKHFVAIRADGVGVLDSTGVFSTPLVIRR